MVTVQFSRQEMVNMVRRGGLRDAASEALRDLAGPVDLDQAEAWGTARHHQKRSHQPHGRQPMTRSAGSRPRRRDAASTLAVRGLDERERPRSRPCLTPDRAMTRTVASAGPSGTPGDEMSRPRETL